MDRGSKLGRIFNSVALFIALALIVSACSSGNGTSTTTTTTITAATTTTLATATSSTITIPEVITTPDGYAVHLGDGFSVLVPEAWFTVASTDLTLSSGAWDVLLADINLEMEEPIPDATLEQWAMLFSQGYRLISADPATDWEDLATTLNLVVFPTNQSAETMLRVTLEELDFFGGEVIDSSTLDLPSGPAYEVIYRIPELGFDGWNINVMVGGEQWTLSLGARDLSDVDVDLRAIASSLQIDN